MTTTKIREALELLRVYADDSPGGSSVGERNLIHDALLEAEAADALEPKYLRAVDALAALTNGDGHIWHGAHSDVCTGECEEVRAVLAKRDTETK